MIRMTGLATLSLGATLLATSAFGAAIERAIPSTTRILYEEGRYLEFGVSYTDPDQSGDDATLPPLLSPTQTPLQLRGQYRRSLREQLELQRRLQGRHQRAAVLRDPVRPALRRRHRLRQRADDRTGGRVQL